MPQSPWKKVTIMYNPNSADNQTTYSVEDNLLTKPTCIITTDTCDTCIIKEEVTPCPKLPSIYNITSCNRTVCCKLTIPADMEIYANLTA